MFTGLITDVGNVIALEERAGELRRLRIACAYPLASMMIGASVACSGICLTLVERGQTGEGAWFEVDIGAETLACTTAAHWKVGTPLNLERSLKVGEEWGGHFVTGHVDHVARVLSRRDQSGMAAFEVDIPAHLTSFVAPKGSICLDGTSLTVNTIVHTRCAFLLIPHTLAATTWNERHAGDVVNLEVDLLARYVGRQMAALRENESLTPP